MNVWYSSRSGGSLERLAVAESQRTVARSPMLIMVAMLLASSGCGGDPAQRESGQSAGRDAARPTTMMLNWFPEAEHGGFYAAELLGFCRERGLELEIRPGGPAAPVAQELVTGRIEFAVANADDVLLYRQQGAPVVALLAAMQESPRCILVHEESGVESLQELRGLTLQAGAGRPYLLFLQARGLLDGVQVVPYSGVARFVADPRSAMQGYTFSEPFLAQQAGAHVRVLKVAELGFNPYASCLITTERMIASQPELVQAMVDACRRGWLAYLDDPQATNLHILKLNEQGMTLDALTFGARELRNLCLPEGMPREQFGRMTRQRWQTLIDQFAELKLVDPQKVAVDSVFDTRFIAAATE
ncbi:MAG: ABC transporter permease [Planctomycetota bacterium]|nr:MAG: ABC transporter permease [Planctomycetota bacterium]